MSLYLPEKTVLYPDGHREDFGQIKMSPAQEEAALKFLILILKTCDPENEKFKIL
jgi:hypothetical protein